LRFFQEIPRKNRLGKRLKGIIIRSNRIKKDKIMVKKEKIIL